MVIIDTSVVFKWFDKKESLRSQARELLKQHLTKQEEIVVPDLLLYEITNAWATKSNLPIDRIQKNLDLLEKYNLEFVNPNFDLVKRAGKFAVEHKVTVYDAIYAVLASEKKCRLITVDEKFIKKTEQDYIQSLNVVSTA